MPKESRKNAERYSAKWLLLTYAQTPDGFDPEKIHSMARAEKAKCRIGKEFHKDGGTHYHAFFEFSKRFQTRNIKHFDSQNCHPNWTIIRYTPWKSWDYVGKDGDVVVEDCERPPETGSGKAAPNKLVFDTLVSARDYQEFVDTFKAQAPKEYIMGFNNICNYANATFNADTQPDYVSPEFMTDNHAPEKLLTWMDGFKAGLEATANETGDDHLFTAKERLAIHSLVYLNA